MLRSTIIIIIRNGLENIIICIIDVNGIIGIIDNW